jgi:hypothetical protein
VGSFCDYFFAFFLRVTQPFFEDSDLDDAVVFFAGVFFLADNFLDIFFFAAVFLVAFLAVAIFYENQNIVFDYDMTRIIGNKDKRNNVT